MMSFITLTTDFGLSDSYVAAMKGVIYKINPSAKIIDISHSIAHQNIRQAAFLMENVWTYFPQNSIHVIVVDPGVGTERKIIALKKKETIFIAPDNGVLSFVYDYDSKQDIIYECNKPKFWLPKISRTFHGRDIFAPLAAHLSKGIGIEQIGFPVSKMQTLEKIKPTVLSNKIEGEIIYIDIFGNCITNIKSDLLRKNFLVKLPNGVMLEGSRSITYADVPLGKGLALIDSFDMLEIAVRGGSAEKQFSLRQGHKIIVTFN